MQSRGMSQNHGENGGGGIFGAQPFGAAVPKMSVQSSNQKYSLNSSLTPYLALALSIAYLCIVPCWPA